jgi:hypothetical protein
MLYNLALEQPDEWQILKQPNAFWMPEHARWTRVRFSHFKHALATQESALKAFQRRQKVSLPECLVIANRVDLLCAYFEYVGTMHLYTCDALLGLAVDRLNVEMVNTLLILGTAFGLQSTQAWPSGNTCLAQLFHDMVTRKPLHPMHFSSLHFHEQKRVLQWAVKTANQPILDLIPNVTPYPCFCTVAAESGNLSLLVQLHRKGCEPTLETFCAARNDPKMLRWLMSAAKNDYSGTMAGFGNVHNLECIEMLCDHGHFKHNFFEEFAAIGRCDLIERWKHRIDEDDVSEMYCAAAKHGQIKVLDWLHSRNYPGRIPPSIACIAAENGHVNVLEWMKAHQLEWHYTAYFGALRSGRMWLVYWLEQHGCLVDNQWQRSNLLDVAIESGDLSCLRWALDHVDANTAPSSIDRKLPVRMVQLLQDRIRPQFLAFWPGLAQGTTGRFEWDDQDIEGISAQVTAEGNLGMLQWTHQRGCPINWWQLDAALSNADAESIQWMLSIERIEVDPELFLTARIDEWIVEFNGDRLELPLNPTWIFVDDGRDGFIVSSNRRTIICATDEEPTSIDLNASILYCHVDAAERLLCLAGYEEWIYS